MKKYGMIFASVIFTLLIMFVPNKEVKAINFSYNGETFDTDEIYQKLNSKYSSLLNFKNSYYKMVVGYGDSFVFYVFPSSSASCINLIGDSSLSCSSSGAVENSNLALKFNYGSAGVVIGIGQQAFSYSYDTTTKAETYTHYKTTTHAAPVFITNAHIQAYATAKEQIETSILYTNFNLYYTNPSNNSDTYIREYDTLSSIIITNDSANDLEGNDIEVVTIDFDGLFSDTYIYQYKTSYSEWIDITDFIKDASLYGYYYYQFNTYYNTTIEARILDNDGNVISSNSLDITNLHDYNDGYIYRNNFSSLTHSNLKYITFQSNFNELNISHNFRLQYLSNDKSIANIPNFIEYKAYLVDINGIILDYDFNEYFSITYDEYKLFEDDYITYLDGTIIQNKELPKKAYGFKIIFEFDNLKNYTINVFDNYSKSTIWGFVQDFLKGYTRIKFPSDYDIAIIRSKNFNNISSSLIYMNVLFTSSEYGLNFYNYDFINKRQNYSYITSDVTIDYSMISFDINESNNIFPILFKNSDSDDVFIYLKDDCFIQFVNRETFESYIVGSDEDYFNNNNDLIIGDDFNDFIDDNFNFNNSSFFEKFSNGFDKFKSVIIEIFQNINYFFERLCSELQYFYIVVFALIIFIFLTRFLL